LTGVLRHWIEESGEDVVASVYMAVTEPNKFQIICHDVPGSFAHMVEGSLLINSRALCLVASSIRGKEPVLTFCELCLDNLVQNQVGHKFVHNNQFVHAIHPVMLEQFVRAGQLGGLLLGVHYFSLHYRPSIVEICVIDDDGDPSTGTGFVVEAPNGGQTIVTCKHVVSNKRGGLRKIVHVKSSEVDLFPREAVIFNEIDLCAFTVEANNRIPCLHFSLGELLEEVITAGFPKIMLSSPSPLLYHRGHINGWTGDPKKVGTAGIISASTAPGCSGGPVFNSYGGVVGVVDQRIETNFKDGESKYSGMIPAELILTQIGVRNYKEPVDVKLSQASAASEP
jgi:hypothetical protein